MGVGDGSLGHPLGAGLCLGTGYRRQEPQGAAKALISCAEKDGENEVLLEESRLQAGLIGTPEQMEVIAAQFAKRAPVFD